MSQHKTPKEHLVPDQVNAAIVGTLNDQRLQDELIKLAVQDTAFSNAIEQIDKTLEFVNGGSVMLQMNLDFAHLPI